MILAQITFSLGLMLWHTLKRTLYQSRFQKDFVNIHVVKRVVSINFLSLK